MAEQGAGNGEGSSSTPDPAAGAAGETASAEGGGGQGFTLHTQYVKDLSFENPNAPRIFLEMKQAPEVSVNLDVGASRLQDRTFEVVLRGDIKATANDKSAFVIELSYGGLVTLEEDISDEQREVLLLIEVPRYMFPFARNVISAATRDGGFPPLLINPVDFSRLYREQKAKRQEAAAESQDQSEGASDGDGGNA